MASEDSRPFVELQQSAEEFMDTFDKDVRMCLNLLESNLSVLIRDPDSMESSSKEGKRLGAHLEFSKAKYDVFMKMKSVAEKKETEWREHIKTMISCFLENVEILLASTNIEPDLKKRNSPNVSKSPKKSSFSPYALFNSAKKLPVINSLLPHNDEEEEDYSEEEDNFEDLNSRVSQLKRAGLKQNTSPKISKIPVKSSPQKEIISNNRDISDDSSEEDEAQELRTPQKSDEIPTRRTTIRSSSAVKETPAKPLRRKIVETPTARPVSKRSGNRSVSEEPAVKGSAQKKNASKSRKSILKIDPSNDSELHTTPSRSTRKRTAVKESNQTLHENDEEEYDESDQEVAAPKTPKNVHFSVGFDVEDDLEIYSPEVNLTRSAPRRKTVLISNVPESSSDFNLTPNIVRSKRKTISGGAMDVSGAPSSKRLKKGRLSNAAPASAINEEEEEPEVNDHLENDKSSHAEHYTPWVLLEDLDGKVPAQPGIYELKVYKAKKSAYIGSCDNLRHKLTLHKLGQSSGHKHLDKFLDRNKNDVQVRYEKMQSAGVAKNEEMKRIKAFVSQHRTTPAYN